MKKLKRNLQNLLKKEKCLVDVYIFGSALKGKDEPKDIDLISLFRDKDYKLIEDINYEIKKIGDKLELNLHIEPLIVDDMFSNRAHRNIIHEGFSIKNMKSVSSILNFDSFLIMRYELRDKKASDKVRFSYALFGRKKGEGVLAELKGRELGKGSILIPIGKEAVITSFFKQWDVAFKKQRVILFS